MTTFALTFALLFSNATVNSNVDAANAEAGVLHLQLDELVTPTLDQLRPTVIEGVDSSPDGIDHASRIC